VFPPPLYDDGAVDVVGEVVVKDVDVEAEVGVEVEVVSGQEARNGICG
jgi:hypothetical protein